MSKTKNKIVVTILMLMIQAVMVFTVPAHAKDEGDPSDRNTKITFEKQWIRVGNKKIHVEVALSQRQHERGLMFRESLPVDEGMIFIFDISRTLQFWMKNTYIDLDIGYFDQDRKLIDIFQMKASSVMTQSPDVYPSSQPAQYALEMNKGWFAKNKIKKGDHFFWLKDQKPEKGQQQKKKGKTSADEA